MALYKPDHKYSNGLKIIENIKDSTKELPRSLVDITDEEKFKLIVYVIQQKDEFTDKLRKQIDEYQKVFDMMGKFIPYKGPTVYK